MARIRTIKPEFFIHEGLADADAETDMPLRLAFIGLWCCADREGRFEWRPRRLKAQILPFDGVSFGDVLEKLASRGFVVKYESDGKEYGHIPSWHSHQSINQRESQSSLPNPGGDDARICTHAQEQQKSEGQNVPPDARKTVLARDGGKCVRCGSENDLTIDHIFPRSIGGTHAITNLRTLCRSCNSARPVAGQALLDDLEKDGLSMADMERICMHVRARGEGKGKEGNKEGKGKEGNKKHLATGAKTPSRGNGKSEPITNETWAAYAASYLQRYGAEPVRNASVNGKLAKFIERVGKDDAPHIAAYFVGLNTKWYVTKGHAVGVMLNDAEKLATEWRTNRTVTETEARQGDQRQAQAGVWQRLLEEERSKHGEH